MPRPNTMRIFVTGSSSHLARAWLPKLCADQRIERVIGVDLAPAIFTHAKFTHHILDIRSPDIGALVPGCDALVHLAWVVLRGKMNAAAMHDVNVRGTQLVFEAARAAGIAHLIHLSSAAVYGSGDKLTEAAPFNPLPGFLYAQHKAEVENYLAREFPETLCLRPHIILGPHCQPLLKQLLHQPCYPRLPDPQPRLQCVHEDDVADAINAGLFNAISGPINLAAAGEYSFKHAIAARYRHPIALPFGMIKTALSLAWRVTGYGGEPAWLDGMRQTLTLDCARAQSTLDWRPKFDADAVLAAVN
ncbi:MAG: NAD-dependent epimerase/dehydratase family protein [Hydrogenophilales bacterium]|nr:NAD-dependent epimerase/dehydratase family protein [Hydrogenophilales bacterium]